MSACVEARAREARENLRNAEMDARQAIQASTDEPGSPKYRSDALAALSHASSAFEEYVDKQCHFEATLASKGNGAEDVRWACIAVLSEERTQRMNSSRPVP
ncbi:lysozyme inhibitor LprI family protein [Dyella solisilvae]